MARSLKKGYFVEYHVLEKVNKRRGSGSREPIKTWSRCSMIIPEMVGLEFHVHNGRAFVPVIANENMVGQRLGEFAPTRKFRGHPDVKKGKK